MSQDQELLIDVRNGVASVTLNRPKALNALNTEMVLAFDQKLVEWSNDPAVKAVLIRGAGGKAFCAGGDIRALYDAKQAGPVPTDFFYHEYVMNSRIHHFEKPYIALIDGITMGGGVGISAPGRYRIASDRTMWAMPETGIGMYPDVGGSYHLPRLPGQLGLYLALTGYRLKAADALYAGVATHFIAEDRLDGFAEALPERPDDIDGLIAAFATDPGPAPLAEHRAQIDRLFSKGSVEEILDALHGDDSAWAKVTEQTLAKMSPTSLKLSLAGLRRGANMNFDDVMKMEYRIVSHIMQGHDFFEGVRAVLVDKDNAPKWSPATVAATSDADIAAYFAPVAKELSL